MQTPRTIMPSHGSSQNYKHTNATLSALLASLAVSQKNETVRLLAE